MKKKILLLMGIFSVGIALHAQIGINTDNPLALFHIDAKGNTTSAWVGVEDDVVVSNAGNLGLGTIAPPNRVSVISSGVDTGLHLPNGSKSGNILTSDVSGHSVWKEGKVQYQTVVYGHSNSWILLTSVLPAFTKVDQLGAVLVDKVKDIYGAAYGWDNANQQYIAPITGKYRITYQVYFGTRGELGSNFRAYLHCNGSPYSIAGLVSVTDTGSQIAAYTMGIGDLNKDDVLDLRIGGHPSGKVSYYSGIGHTFLIIESL